MSEARKCDRCGSFYGADAGSLVTIAAIDGGDEFDLCDECAESLLAWMEDEVEE